MQGRAALWHVYQKFKLSAGAALAVDYQTLMALKFEGNLKGFMHSWDSCVMAMSQMPSYEFLHAVLEPQLRRCKALAPAFVNLDGADSHSYTNPMIFLSQSCPSRNR